MNFYRKVNLFTIVWLSLVNTSVQAQPYERPSEPDPAIDFASIGYHDYQMHYAYSGDADRHGILFIHGTPGGWSAFEMYLSNKMLQRDFFMVSVDRLGWGKSNVNPALAEANKVNQKTENSTAEKSSAFSLQAGSIAAVMRRYPNKKWLLVGHSLGASIAPKVALLTDQETESPRVTGMLLLAGSLDPKLGKPRWFNRAANSRLLKWLLPIQLKYSNDEIMALREELRDIETELTTRQLATEVVIMQGMKDNLVSPKNPRYVMEVWPQSFTKLRALELPEAGHFLPWRQTQLVIETIREFKF